MNWLFQPLPVVRPRPEFPSGEDAPGSQAPFCAGFDAFDAQLRPEDGLVARAIRYARETDAIREHLELRCADSPSKWIRRGEDGRYVVTLAYSSASGPGASNSSHFSVDLDMTPEGKVVGITLDGTKVRMPQSSASEPRTQPWQAVEKRPPRNL
jgi:hypothetical protein